MASPPLPPFFQFLAISDIIKATTEKGSGEYYPLYAGQGAGSLRDLPRAADVVQTSLNNPRIAVGFQNGGAAIG